MVVGLKFLSPPSLAVKQERTGGTWGGNCLYILYITSLPLCVFFGCNFFIYSSCGYVDMGFCVFLRGVIYIFFHFSSFYERVMCLSV